MDKAPYTNFVEWKEPATFQELLKRNQVQGLEVTEATQEEYDIAQHAFINKQQGEVQK